MNIKLASATGTDAASGRTYKLSIKVLEFHHWRASVTHRAGGAGLPTIKVFDGRSTPGGNHDKAVSVTILPSSRPSVGM